MVTFTDSDDRRSAHLRNQAIQNANAVRERRATVENPQWAMSRPADWYTELNDQEELSNLRSIKDTLVSQQGNRDFWTTDQDESRNAYQMLMNQMKGGDKGARMMDLRGLPSVVQSDPNKYRRGRTMFQDPSKAQGFLGDVGSLYTGKNKAAVYADEYNPFPKAGFGEQVYKDKFPIASGLDSLMGLAEKSPTLQFLTGMIPKRNRVPLERHPDYLEGGPEFLPKKGIYTKIPEIPFVEDEAVDRSDPLPLENWFYTPPFDDEVSIMDLPIEEDITETITEDDTETITEGDGEKFVLKEAKFSQGNLGTQGKYDYSPTWDLNIRDIQDYELKKKATDAAIQFNNMWIEKEGKEEKSDMSEFERLWDEYMDAVEAGAQSEDSLIEDINLTEDDFEGVAFDFDKNLEDQAESLNEIERLKNIQRDNNFLFDI